MAYEMNGKRLRRPIQCVMEHCRKRDTYLFYKGGEYGLYPIHLCPDCIRDIVDRYIDLAGVDDARKNLADVMGKLAYPAPEEPDEEQEEAARETEDTPKRGRRKKADE